MAIGLVFSATLLCEEKKRRKEVERFQYLIGKILPLCILGRLNAVSVCDEDKIFLLVKRNVEG